MILAVAAWAVCAGAVAVAAPAQTAPPPSPSRAAPAAEDVGLWVGGASLAPNALRVWATVAVLGATGAWLTLRGRRASVALGPRPAWRAGRVAGPLRVVAERALSGPHRLALVEVDGADGTERLVVALSPQGAQLLSRLPAAPATAPASADAAPGPAADLAAPKAALTGLRPAGRPRPDAASRPPVEVAL